VLTRVVDDSCGPAESISFVDFQLNGKKELMVNIHAGGPGGSIYAYGIPDDLEHGEFNRTTIATGMFKVTEKGIQ